MVLSHIGRHLVIRKDNLCRMTIIFEILFCKSFIATRSIVEMVILRGKDSKRGHLNDDM